jgi:hypothetical protein
MRATIPSYLMAVPVVALTLLGGCAGSDGSTGQLSLAVTDAPVDEATSVVVAFTGVELKPAGGPSQTFHFCLDANADEPIVQTTACDTPAPRQIDLLALQGGGSELILDGVTVPAGRYNWVRLMVEADPASLDSYIELSDGGVYPLYVPSADRHLEARLQRGTAPQRPRQEDAGAVCGADSRGGTL